MTETDIMNSIRIELSGRGYTVFRANVGKFKMGDGRWFDTGLPKGFTDLFAVKDGRAYFIEVKKPGGKVREEQINFIKKMRENGCIAGIAYSVEEAVELVSQGT